MKFLKLLKMYSQKYIAEGPETEKKKLLEKQKKGKAHFKQFGRVEIPQEVFIGALRINKET